MNWITIFDVAAWLFWGAVIMTAGPLLILKTWDAVRAWAYNLRNIQPKTACECPSCSPHLYAEMPAVLIITRTTRVTADRPQEEDPWMDMVAEDIDEMTEVDP